MSNLQSLTEKQYEQQYNSDLELFNSFTKNLQHFEKEDIYETNNQPMHPNMYYQLANVSGFCDLNGNTYSQYLENWKSRSKK